ncbi:MAG: hypothetical protein U0575_04130 [Phycisphaerales bacterium]
MSAPIERWTDIEAAPGSGGDANARSLRRFEMVAYTGTAMELAGWDAPVVIDLAGISIRGTARPILKDHSPSMIVGHTESVGVEAGRLRVSGLVSGSGRVAGEIVESSKNGFPWQASVGAKATRVEFVKKGQSAAANGRTFEGPAHIVRASTLSEISFVALGADDDTSARVAAIAPANDGGDEDNMDNVKDDAAASDNGGMEATDPIAAMRTQAAAEVNRLAALRAICTGHPDIEAKAIVEGWSTEKAELTVLRAARPASGPFINSGKRPLTQKVLEAAACLSAGVSEKRLLRDFGEQTLDAAQPLRAIGLKDLAANCARLEGKDIPHVFGDGTATIQAAFTTLSLPTILEGTMQRTMLEAYEAIPLVALDVCRVASVKDFREVTRVRLLGAGRWEKVAQDGELQSGKLSEQTFKNQAETRGILITLTRQDIINDDLGAFLDLPRQVGMDGAATIDDEFFRLLLSNPSSFFSVGNGNFLSGADTAFGVDSLSLARATFQKIKIGPGTDAKDQKPINIRPTRLLVPVEVETDAQVLLGSAQIMLDGSSSKTKLPTDNPHRGKYELSVAPHLSDTYYTGNSAKAWYLFADPRLVAAFELVFLNGKQQPTIERTPTPANTLGVSWAAYIDFGVREQDPRGAIKVKGEV